MGATDDEERALADLRFGSGNPANWFWGLSNSVPNGDGSNVIEPVGFGYTRVTIANNTTSFPNAITVGGVTTKTNGVKITYPNPTGTWGLALYWVAFLTLTGGVCRYFNPLDSPISIRAGNTPVEFDISQLILPWKGA